jgi:hypothetical protein
LLIGHSITGYPAVVPFVFFRKRVLFTPFLWQLTGGMDAGNTQVPGIDQELGPVLSMYLRLLEEPKVMPFAIGECRTDHLEVVLVHHKLRFQGVPFFLA